MSTALGSKEVGVSMDGHVATVELKRPPNNFLDVDLIEALANALEALDREPACRSVVLAAEGKHFCAGANLMRRLNADPAAPVGNEAPVPRSAAAGADPQADRRRGPRQRDRRRPGTRARRRFPRDLQGSASCRQLHRARLSPRLRADRDAAAASSATRKRSGCSIPAAACRAMKRYALGLADRLVEQDKVRAGRAGNGRGARADRPARAAGRAPDPAARSGAGVPRRYRARGARAAGAARDQRFQGRRARRATSGASRSSPARRGKG